MGREATTLCTAGAQQDTLKALLESTELILRGPLIRRRWPVAALQAVRVQGDDLCFTADGDNVTLHLGAKEAAAWARKISTPPPTLAHKLGLRADAPAMVLGTVEDEALHSALTGALKGAVTSDATQAALLIAIITNAADLDTAMAQHARMACAHLWIVHHKGKSAHLGDTAIRTTLRAGGYADTKVSAVSDRWSATRYTKAAAGPSQV